MTSTPRALIADSDAANLAALAELFEQTGYAVETAGAVAQAREAMLKRAPEVALLNERLGDEDVMELLELVDFGPVMELYMMTDEPSVRGATRAMQLGASDYFAKPIDRDRLSRNLEHLADELGGNGQGRTADADARGLLIGESPPMQRLYRLIRKCAPSEATVLLVGESGSGKELAAQTIHELSGRAGHEFVTLNCSAVAPELIESELFGHRKGSFTGAQRDHKGFFERASSGTLFLDEITEMSPALQAKLLRVLESGLVTPVGGEAEIPANPRIVAATNRDPDESVGAGSLREDLYYRLAQFPIRVPALRERGDDVELLALHFLAEHNRHTGESKRFSEDVLEAFRVHDWPGNVRELKNAVVHGCLLAEREIGIHDLPGSIPSQVSGRGDFIRVAIGTSLAEVERRTILATLEHFEGDKKRAAEVLGISLKTLYNRLNAYRQRGGGD